MHFGGLVFILGFMLVFLVWGSAHKVTQIGLKASQTQGATTLRLKSEVGPTVSGCDKAFFRVALSSGVTPWQDVAF